MKKYGFTLIELIAVIIILAVVTLLAVPTLIDVIGSSKESGRKSSVAGFADAVKFSVVDNSFSNGFKYSDVNPTWVYGDGLTQGNTVYSGGKVICSEISYSDSGVFLNDCQVGNYEDVKYCYINNNVFEGEGCLITDANYVSSMATDESCFTFDFSTKTITAYDESCGGLDVIIPRFFTNGEERVAVENIGAGAFINGDEVFVSYEDRVSQVCVDSEWGVCNFDIPYHIAIERNIAYDYATPAKFINGVPPTRTCYHSDDVPHYNLPYDSYFDATSGYVNCYYAYGSYEYPSGNLTSVNFSLSKYLKSIDIYAFYPNQINNVNFKNLINLQTIGDYAFAYNQIADLDLSNLPSLQSIGYHAFELNHIKSLDLSNSVNLQIIKERAFIDNEITSINLSNLPNLQTFDRESFSENQITDIDFSGLTGLKTIGRDAFSSNLLTSLDLSNLPLLETIDKGAFSNNQLTTVTLSNLPNLQTVGSVAFFKNEWSNTNLNVIFNYTGKSFLWSQLIYGSYQTLEPFEFGEVIDNQGNIDISNGSCYDFDATTKTINKYYRYCGNEVEIPREIDGVTVENIASNAFEGKNLTKVTILDNILTIGDRAFANNNILQGNITIDKLKCDITIDRNAFVNNGASKTETILPTYLRQSDTCDQAALDACLTFESSTGTITDYMDTCGNEPVIPSQIHGVDVVAIGDQAFYNKQLISVTIPTSVTTIGSDAFASNQLTDVIIPNSVTTMGSGAFGGNLLSSVTISSGLTTINSCVFCYNQLESVTIPNGIIEIGEEAFSNNQLTSMEIADSVTTIGNSAFSSNAFTSLTIPNNVINIGEGTFSSNMIEELNIPNNIEVIASYAFYSNALTSVTLPASVSSLGFAAFGYNQTLTSISVDVNNSNYKSINNAIYSKDGTVLYSGISAIANNIESTTQSIYSGAFIGMGLTSVTIPINVTNIGSSSFSSNNLTNLVIPSNVRTIDESAFSFNQLTNVTINNGVTSIGDMAFYFNHLTGVTIPNSVINIGANAFIYNRLEQGNVIIDNSIGAVTIGNEAFCCNGTSWDTTIIPSYLR